MMMIILCGCGAKENDVVKLYQSAFDETFKSSYSSLTTIEEGGYITNEYDGGTSYRYSLDFKPVEKSDKALYCPAE